MKIKVLLLCLLIIPTIILTGDNQALAISSSAISVNVVPANPAPYQNVTITLSSFSANLDTVNIVWLVDGQTSSSGIGKKSFSVTAKAVDIETRIEAKIYLPDGEISKRVTIRPATLVLLWEANDSYVPPFYKGKAWPSIGSEIKVVALPEITVGNTMLNPKNMAYVWKLDYNNMPSSSGYGKNFFTFINDYLENSNSVSVTVNTTDQKYQAEAKIELTTVNPEIVFYRKDSQLGVEWEKAVANNYLIQGEEIIVAEPYFISPKDWRRPDLVYSWSINNRLISVPNYAKNFIPLKATPGVSGTSKLKLEIENTDKIFQTTEKEINIQF